MAGVKYPKDYLETVKSSREYAEIAIEVGLPKVITDDGSDLGTPLEFINNHDWSKPESHLDPKVLLMTTQRWITLLCEHQDAQLS